MRDSNLLFRPSLKYPLNFDVRTTSPLFYYRGRPHIGMNNMVWFMLVIAGLFEVVWAIGLKYTDGFTRLIPSVISVVAMVLSVGLLGLAMKTLPIGTAYAVWVGIGVIGTALLGMLVFGESVSLLKIVSLALIVLGIVGLKISTT